MASRRVRIKGIANIPVRRKNEAANTEKDAPKTEEKGDELVEKTDQQTNNIEKSEQDFNKLTDVASLNTNSLLENSVEKPQETELPSDNHVNTEISDSQKDNDITSLNNNVTSVKNLTTTTEVLNNNVLQEKSDKTEEKNTENDTSSQKAQPENKFARRWVPKPSVKIPARRAKPEVIERKKEEIVPKPVEINSVASEPISIPLPLPEENIVSTPPILSTPLSVITNDDTTNISKTVVPEKVTSISKSTSDDNLKSITNTEPILTSPLSPSKSVNRARIRPVPRLIRRNSVQGSASESEDDGRKSNRTRNDSVCSTSTIETFTREETLLTKNREIKIISQRKVRYTEQSRKMATARREFHIKFGTQTPDRKKLTMMDLIYYNPTTNPMPEKSTKSKSETSEVIINEEQAEEELEDDPGQGSDEENIPVPQVKVGPDGEIILDEQSLVIEQTGTKKGREQIANSQIVIDDLDTGYGIYKRPKKSKDWSITETLRFYRTLNTVGTDFSLMLSLFPNRTRRELKLKFKKEERINRVLIDKVLMNPMDFNLAELEKQFEDEQTVEQVEKSETKPKVKEPRVRKKRSLKSSSLSRQMDDENDEKINVKPKKRIKTEKLIKDPYSILINGLDSIIDTDSEEEATTKTNIKSLTNKDTNGDKPNKKRPTRTCRLRKPRSILESGESDIDDINPDDDYVENEINGNNIEPKPVCVKKKTKSVSFKTNDIDSEPMEFETNTILAHLEPPKNKLEKFYKDLPSMEGMDVDNTCEEFEPQLETNVTIAHSEDEEPDKISIDIISKNSTDTGSNETKVSLQLIKQGDELIQVENIQNTEITESTKVCISNGTDETDLHISNGNDEIPAIENIVPTNIDLPESPQSNLESDVSKLIPQDLPLLEPGSLMILSSPGPNGEEIFKVFMVTPNKEKIPVDLSPDIVESLTTSLGTEEEVTLDLPVISDKS